MIVYKYFLNYENFICGWTQLNTDTNTEANDLKEIQEPLQEMNLLPQKDNKLFNKKDNCFYKLIDKKIVKVNYVPDKTELFEEKYTVSKRLELIEKAIINPNDPDWLEYLEEKNDLEEEIT